MSIYILSVYIPFRNALRKDEPVHWAQVPRLLGLGRVRKTAVYEEWEKVASARMCV